MEKFKDETLTEMTLVRLEIRIDKKPPHGSFLFFSNHFSNLDIPIPDFPYMIVWKWDFGCCSTICRNGFFLQFFIKNTIHVRLATIAPPFLIKNKIPERIKNRSAVILFCFPENMRMSTHNHRRAVVYEKMRQFDLRISRLNFVLAPPMQRKNFFITMHIIHRENIIFRIIKRINVPSFIFCFVKIFLPIICIRAKTIFSVIHAHKNKFSAFSFGKARMQNFGFIKRVNRCLKSFHSCVRDMIVRERNNPNFLIHKPRKYFNISWI